MAEDKGAPFIEKKLKMQLFGKFESGQPEVTIYKLYDPSDDVICYALMPDHVLSNKTDKGISYEANSVGAISCLKNRQVVIPIPPTAQTNTPSSPSK
jgi:hypothetical protein